MIPYRGSLWLSGSLPLISSAVKPKGKMHMKKQTNKKKLAVKKKSNKKSFILML